MLLVHNLFNKEIRMNKFYIELEGILQKKIIEGWKNFNNSTHHTYCKEYHEFLWKQEEYNQVHRKRLYHAPYEYAARFIGIPFMNELLKLGIYMNAWFPGYFDIIDEFADGTRYVVKHPAGRITYLVLFCNDSGNIKELCKIAIEFHVLHQDKHNAFGFREPILKMIETYHEHPEKIISLNKASEPTKEYHLMCNSESFSGLIPEEDE